MRKIAMILLCVLSLSSCAFFETEKISSDVFYQEEIKDINWKDVDRYPLFATCESFSEKQKQKQCFEATLAAHMQASISLDSIKVSEDINDTIHLGFSIDKTGALAIDNVQIPLDIETHIPMLETWIMESMTSLEPTTPAYKRGIPVASHFVLPIVINTQ